MMSYVRCIDNTGYEVSLTLGQVYKTLPDRSDKVSLRIIDNEGEDYLYDGRRFEQVELTDEVWGGVKTNFADADEWWEEALLRHPQFQQRIVQARKSACEGKGITIEQLRAELALEAPVVTTNSAEEQYPDSPLREDQA